MLNKPASPGLLLAHHEASVWVCRAAHKIQRSDVHTGLAMGWMDEIIDLAGPAVTMVAPRMVHTPGPGLGVARYRLFWLDTILLS